MATVSIGNHSKVVARHSDQERIRAFYQGVLGCVLTKESANVDYIKFHQGFFLAVLYQDAVPTQEQLRQSIWLELRSDEPAELRKKIVDFGVTEIEMPETERWWGAPDVYTIKAWKADLRLGGAWIGRRLTRAQEKRGAR